MSSISHVINHLCNESSLPWIRNCENFLQAFQFDKYMKTWRTRVYIWNIHVEISPAHIPLHTFTTIYFPRYFSTHNYASIFFNDIIDNDCYCPSVCISLTYAKVRSVKHIHSLLQIFVLCKLRKNLILLGIHIELGSLSIGL